MSRSDAYICPGCGQRPRQVSCMGNLVIYLCENLCVRQGILQGRLETPFEQSVIPPPEPEEPR